MIPHVYTIDEFFSPAEFMLLRDYAHILEYRPIESPLDHVTYPNIGLPVPPVIEERVVHAMSWVLGYRIVPKIMAFRLSPEGSNPPQWAHTDAEGSQYALFVYINPGPAATVLLEHRATGMRVHPANEIELEAWKRDYQDEEAWRVVGYHAGEPNRAILMRSNLMHAALPRRGYGRGPLDARLILLCFFD